MKNNLLILVLLSGWTTTRADIKFVNYSKIDPSGRYEGQYHSLLDHLPYFDHWSPDWSYEIPRDSLVGELKTGLILYASLKADEFETDLLLGELSHYLYNLDQQNYYDTAVAYYLKAIRLKEKDLRGYWFLGYHYSQSDKIVDGIGAFEKARKLVSEATPGEFWQEYAFAMELGSMPSHCRYALDQYKRRGGNSLLSRIMDSTLRANCIQADPDSVYSDHELWEGLPSVSGVTMVSRPLGVSLEVDSADSLKVNDFAGRKTALIMQSSLLPGLHGRSFGYNIGLVIKIAENGEELSGFMKQMMPPGVTRDPVFAFSSLYPHGISYTLQSNSFYKDRGGAHAHFVGIERESPAYPGLSLENHAEDIHGESGRVELYTLSHIRNRFPGRIFYFFVLDTCGDIYKKSWEDFSRLMTRGLLLE